MRQRHLWTAAISAVAAATASGAQAQPANQENAAAAAQPAADATSEGGLQDIVVTAQRRSENLQRVPISVSAATTERLTNSGIQNTIQLAEVIPGLTFTFIAGNTQVRIRGVGTNAFGPGIENPAAIYVDGVYLASTAAALFNLANIERVEVLKGPQGTLFGRNATGGLVQIITPDPSFDFRGLGRVTYGNYDTGSVDLYATGAVSSTVAADMAVHYQRQGDGYGTNILSGKDVNRQDHDLIFRSKLMFQPQSGVKFVLTGDYSYNKGSAGLTIQQKPGVENIGVFEKLVTNRLDANPANDLPLVNHGGFYDINANVEPRGVTRSYGLSLHGTIDLGGIDLKSISSYRRTIFDEAFDIERMPQDFLRFDGTAKFKQLSQELQLSSNSGGPFVWTAGVYYFHSRDQWDPFGFTFGTAGAPFIFPGFTLVEQTIEDFVKTDSLAGYAQGTYEIMDGTRLTLGGRYTHEKREFGGTQQFIGFIGPVAIPLVPPGTPVPTPNLGIPSKVSFNNFSYRIAVDQEIADRILAYASYSTGFKSGGFNSQVPSNVPFKPEKLKAWEVGLKTELFDRRLRLNLAAFTYGYTNIQVNNYQPNGQLISNGAAARIKGVELEMLAQPVSGLTFNGSLAYTHDRFTNYPDADYNFLVPDCDFSIPNSSRVCRASANGNKLPGSPTFTASLGFNYEHELASGKLGLSGNVYHNSGFYGTTDNDPRIHQEDYQLVNSSIYWESADNLRVTLWGKNLFDKDYARNVIISSNAVSYVASAPRTYGVTIEQKF